VTQRLACCSQTPLRVAGGRGARSSRLSLENPVWLSPMIATFRYPLHTPFTEHMYIYLCIQVLLPFQLARPAGLGDAAGAGPAGGRFAAPPRRGRPARGQVCGPAATCTAGSEVWALPSASPRRLRRRRQRWHRRGACRAEAVAKAAEARRSYEI
jgi:hypothetical protein